jgi:hypothetical protein
MKEPLERTTVDGKVILKWISIKYDVKVWTELEAILNGG